MTLLFLGMPEIIMLIVSSVVPLGIAVTLIYAMYRMINRWVNKSVEVRKEQNALLAKLVDKLNKTDNPA